MDTLDSATWRKSSYTGTNGNCVEVGDTTRTVQVRDTKDRAGAVLTLSAEAWRSFLGTLK